MAQKPKPSLFDATLQRVRERQKKRCMVCDLGPDAVEFVRRAVAHNDLATTKRIDRLGLDAVAEALRDEFKYAGGRQPLCDHARLCMKRTRWGTP